MLGSSRLQLMEKLSGAVLLLLCWLSSAGLFANEPASGIAPSLLFQRYDSSHGLPDVRIRNLFQDSKGYLWVGTMNGLARYDGYNFHKYDRGNTGNTLSGNWTYAICEDLQQNMWFGTRDGLTKLNRKEESFKTFNFKNNNKNAPPGNSITALMIGQDGRLWVGTNKGLCVYNEKTNSFKRFDSYPFKDGIAKIIQSYEHKIWIATHEGVIHFDTRTEKYVLYKIPVRTNPYGDHFWTMLEEGKDLYLTTGGDGLIKMKYNSVTHAYDPYEYLNKFPNREETLKNTQIFDISRSKSGELWLGTEYGLAKISRDAKGQEKLTFYTNNAISNKSISNNIVYKVLIDKNNVLWCGTENGLNKLDLNLSPFHYFTFRDKNIKDQVRSVFSADGKKIWFGTANTGLFNYNVSSNVTGNLNPLIGISAKNNRSLFADGDNLMVGSLAGVARLNTATSEVKSILGNRAVFAMIKDVRGNTWIGTNKGLCRLTKEGQLITYEHDPSASNAIRSGFIRSIFEDHYGRIWLGFENGKLGVLDVLKKQFIPVEGDQNGNRVIGNKFFTIMEYPKGVIWAGSESGLTRITIHQQSVTDRLLKVKTYTEGQHLPDKSINGLLSDGLGNIWIGTIKGLVRFNPAKNMFRAYFPEVQFTEGSCFKTKTNQLIFGSNDGFIVFDPAKILDNDLAPEVLFTDLKMFNKNVSVGEVFNGSIILDKPLSASSEIRLNHLNNVISIGFTALHFSSPQQNLYAYKMEGFDKEWIHTDASNRIATYTNLDPGTYLFKVKAANYAGKWNAHPAVLKITVLPPPWKTWWAILGYILAFNSILFIFIKYSIAQNKQRSQIHFEKMEKEQLKNLNQMKVKFFTDISHEFRTPLSLIVSPVEDILSNESITGVARKKVEMVYRNCKKLLYLIEELMTFQKMDQGMLKLALLDTDLVSFSKEVFASFSSLAERNGIDFQFRSAPEYFVLPVDRGKLEMILNNLLFNAFKFTPKGGCISLHLDLKKDGAQQLFSIEVEDNGQGITVEQSEHLFERFFSETNVKGTGVGLSLTKSLVEMHQGNISVTSEPGICTIFKVLLPVSQHDLDKQATPLAAEVYLQGSDFHLSTPSIVAPEELEVLKSPHQLLIVDDNVELLDYLEMLFQERYQIIRAENGLQALQKIEMQQPDLIISDVMMPEMDGVELCAKVKNELNTCHIPLILLTAKSTVEDKLRGLKTGADDYIPKPFHPDVLQVRVEKLIQAQKRIQEKYQSGGVVIPENISRNPLDEEFLQKVVAAIEANISNEAFSVEDLGDVVCMSRSHLFRKLKAITGHNPLEVIYGIRLKRAMELLLERRMNISEIAYEVGFKNPSSFTASFKRQYGKTPSEYLNDVLAKDKAKSRD